MSLKVLRHDNEVPLLKRDKHDRDEGKKWGEQYSRRPREEPHQGESCEDFVFDVNDKENYHKVLNNDVD